MAPPPVFSHYQIRPLLTAHTTGKTAVSLSLDLNRSTTPVALNEKGLILPDGPTLLWAALEPIADDENGCYQLAPDGTLQKIQAFSETLNRVYTLYPTPSAPTMLISGIPMHRIKGTDPYRDTQSKIKTIAPLNGHVLDTTMGLGYTAIAAAETAVSVTTIELDPTVLDICRANPWSQELFTNPHIQRLLGDAYDQVETLPDAHFTRIIHDPPTFSLAGHLYSTTFYQHLHRLLTAKGRLFHYIGNPDSRSGASVTRGTIQRLQEAGFRRVRPAPRAFGVVAYK